MTSESDNIAVRCSKYQDGRVIIQVAIYRFSPLKLRLNFGPHDVGFVVDKETMGLVFLPVIRFSSVSITSPLHTHSSIFHQHYVSQLSTASLDNTLKYQYSVTDYV
jgi:hypothetical protein